MSFDELITNYKIYASKRHKKQAYNNLMYNFNYRVLPYLENIDIFNLTKKDIINWKEYIYTFNYSNSYNDDLYYVFNEFLDFCVLYDIIDDNYLKTLGGFVRKNEYKNTDYYTLNEFNRFIKGVDHIVYKSFFILMFYTGTRPSEAMALTFNDFNGKYISINKSIERRGNRNFCTTKNKYSNRTIIINNIVKKYINKLIKYYSLLYGTFDYNYYIFGGKRPLAPTTIDRYKKLACIKSNIRPITQHQFRHSFATYLISKNIPVNVVSKLLGHSNIETTTRVYIHNDLIQEKRVLKTLNSRFSLFL